ncbi:uncharacterized protein MYCFIDRAFT_35047 [Pseudocercospora fijiensis CIRAD86]|uniref:Peptidase S8/S53 domain-containing protein n=1 Tax=Pseudocercospora fijiensis (strain CIRAD86) TaxID=383855 RepID=M3AQN1_PSEFD|nr:uncharacterized protein MYCFIDRAFT_35047 [Pseudocercospora fijiensis CIRAD86]EME79398.1 hypothetical protein MYCFIDRAFT_35047 [Pseudocercospora fijiensis CIRAD86]
MRSFLTLLLAVPAAFADVIIDKRQTPNTIAGKWIARVDENSPLATVLQAFRTLAAITPSHQYEIGSFKAFAFDAPDSLLALISTVGGIKSIEPDTKVFASAPVSMNPDELVKRALTLQSGAEYGLARISHRAKGQSGYIYDTSAGAGTTVYVIDTGVYTQHSEFGGRATMGANFVSGESATDGNGHGTHCAGTVAGSTYGVAKKANIIGVKVLGSNGSGSNSQVLAGIDWAVKDAQNKGLVGKSVISMSLGGSFSQQSNDAVKSATSAGVFAAIAAGNDGKDARNYSPASETSACTVGATDSNDAKASFSNYGPVVDIFAPGVNIKSSWIGSTTSTNTISGTSMATPHIAGLAAYLIALEGSLSPSALCSRIQDLSTKDVITSAGARSPNYLAYNGNGA